MTDNKPKECWTCRFFTERRLTAGYGWCEYPLPFWAARPAETLGSGAGKDCACYEAKK